MSTQSMAKRLDKVLGRGDSGSYADALQAARTRAKAWNAAGNSGPMPFDPLPDLPVSAPRAQRELHAAMTAGRARVERARELDPKPNAV